MGIRTWMGWSLALALLPAAAQTVEQDPAPEDKLTTIVEQQRALQADLDDGGIDGLTTRQANTIRKAQAEDIRVEAEDLLGVAVPATDDLDGHDRPPEKT